MTRSFFYSTLDFPLYMLHFTEICSKLQILVIYQWENRQHECFGIISFVPTVDTCNNYMLEHSVHYCFKWNQLLFPTTFISRWNIMFKIRRQEIHKQSYRIKIPVIVAKWLRKNSYWAGDVRVTREYFNAWQNTCKIQCTFDLSCSMI